MARLIRLNSHARCDCIRAMRSLLGGRAHARTPEDLCPTHSKRAPSRHQLAELDLL